MKLNKGVVERHDDDLISQQLFSLRDLSPLLGEEHIAWSIKMESLFDKWLDRLLALIEETTRRTN